MGDPDIVIELRKAIAGLRDVVRELRDDASAWREVAHQQAERIAELESRLKRDSRTSLRPPSSDAL